MVFDIWKMMQDYSSIAVVHTLHEGSLN